jgi:hypothetical protein
MLPEVSGESLGLAGRLPDPLSHLPEHAFHRVHRICKRQTPGKERKTVRNVRNLDRPNRRLTRLDLERGGTHSSGPARGRRQGRRCRGCRRRQTAWRWPRGTEEAGARPPARAAGRAPRHGQPRRWARLPRADSCRRRNFSFWPRNFVWRTSRASVCIPKPRFARGVRELPRLNRKSNIFSGLDCAFSEPVLRVTSPDATPAYAPVGPKCRWVCELTGPT